MKITHAGLKDAFVLEVDLGDVPVWEVDYGETKLYPDTETGVKQAKFRVPERGTAQWCRFVHALNTVKRECSAECNMIMRVAGREYSLFGSVNGLPVARMTNEGYVTFPDGHAPTLQELAEGVRASLYAKIPQVKSDSIGGNEAGYGADAGANLRAHQYVERVYSPIISGTEVYGYCYKGQKKVSTGNLVIVTGHDGETLMYKHIQQNGHGRGSYEWCYGTLNTAAESVTLTVIPHQARGPWGGYFVYPAFEGRFDFTLEGIVFCQEDDDKFDN